MFPWPSFKFSIRMCPQLFVGWPSGSHAFHAATQHKVHVATQHKVAIIGFGHSCGAPAPWMHGSRPHRVSLSFEVGLMKMSRSCFGVTMTGVVCRLMIRMWGSMGMMLA